MEKKHDILRLEITSLLKQVAPLLEEKDIYQSLTYPPDKNLGDYAYPCFILSKSLKKSPALVATEIVAKIKENFPVNFLSDVISAGPYVNFFIQPSFVGQSVLNEILDGRYFQKKLTEKTPKTMIEYSQPNTHKELHVGHMRNLCLGDALVKLHRYASYDLMTSTFPGDMGTHVAKCLWYFKKYNTEPVPLHNKGAFLGSLYTKAYLKLEDEKETPQEAKNREELTQILLEIEEKNGPYFDLWQETRKWSLEQMHEVYRWANVSFDHWYFESEVDADSLKLVQKYLDKGIFVRDDGAIGADLKEDNLGFCLLVKSDGRGLYATKDLELALRKFKDHHIEKNIYIVDKRQELHFKQVFKILEKMGIPEAKNCYHLKYDFVELPDGAMSSRKGNIVPLQTLTFQMEEKIKNDYLARYTDWTDEEKNKIAHQVAQGAIKYGMVSIDPQKKIVFDMAAWLKLDGESGPYIQYVFARITSLLRKAEYKITLNTQWNLLATPVEKELMLKLADFNHVVLMSCEQYKTHLLTHYLYELAKLFNSFYAECPMMNAESNLKEARLSLSFATSQILKVGLNLLGIPAPEKM